MTAETAEATTTRTASPTMLAYDVEVDAVEPLGPGLVRLTFGGEVLAGFDPAGDLGPRDMRVKLLIPRPGQVLSPLGDLDDGWYQQWLGQDPQERGAMRTYTIRRAHPDAARPQVVVDFVVHTDADGEQGPGSGFASRARPGDRLTILGPYREPGTPSRADEGYGGIEFRPPPASVEHPVRLLLAGDETAGPAICSILETLPDGYAGHALIEVPSAADAQDISASAGGGAVEVTWIARDGAPRGERLQAGIRELLVSGEAPTVAPPGAQELAEVDVDAEIIWETTEPTSSANLLDAASEDTPGDFYAWLAGEAAMIRDLRRLLVRDHGVDRTKVAFMGYWRAGRAEG